MSLLTPIALALGITLPIVIVFYLLKVRRRDEEVSSTFLWNDLIRDLAAHEPLQRLNWNLLLLLQLIALALITFAVARPFSEQIGQKPVQAVLLLDGSASMQAKDVQPLRLAQAVDDGPGGQPTTGNAAVTRIATRPGPRDNRRRQLFTRVENAADGAGQGVITITVDGQAVEGRAVDLPANGKSEQVFEELPAGAR